MKQKVIYCDATKADQAFAAHRALLVIEARQPELRDNPVWTMLRQDAFERFALAFQEVGN